MQDFPRYPFPSHNSHPSPAHPFPFSLLPPDKSQSPHLAPCPSVPNPSSTCPLSQPLPDEPAEPSSSLLYNTVKLIHPFFPCCMGVRRGPFDSTGESLSLVLVPMAGTTLAPSYWKDKLQGKSCSALTALGCNVPCTDGMLVNLANKLQGVSIEHVQTEIFRGQIWANFTWAAKGIP